MKPKPVVAAKTEPLNLINRTPLSSELQPEQPVEPSDLFQEEIVNRASATTQVLAQILKEDDDTHYAYHWGINE